jgi:hypothetical protein
LQVSACGFPCEVCHIRAKGLCPLDGCVPGTDPRAPEILEKSKETFGRPCPILECAIKNNIHNCWQCEKFPCKIHFDELRIYDKKVLDILEELLKSHGYPVDD